MAGDLSRWMGAVSDIKKAEEYNKKPPLFKKLFNAGSVEEESMEIFMAKKKQKICEMNSNRLSHLPEVHLLGKKLLRTEADIRKKRQQAIYDQQERRKQILEWIAIGVLVLVVGGFIFGLIYLWLNRGY